MEVSVGMEVSMGMEVSAWYETFLTVGQATWCDGALPVTKGFDHWQEVCPSELLQKSPCYGLEIGVVCRSLGVLRS